MGIARSHPAWALVIASIGAATAAGPVAPQKTEPWRTLAAQLLQVQNSVSSVDRMIERDMAGFSSAGGGNWLEQCCRYNIDKVQSGVAELRRGLDYLEGQYARRSDLEAIKPLARAREHLDEIESGFLELGRAQSKQQAESKMQTLVHPFSHVRQTIQDLEVCCPVEPPAPAESP
jgi:hypothetical protein